MVIPMEKKNYIIRSKAVYDGVSEEYKEMAILIQGDRIAEILPWNVESSGKYAEIPLYDYGDRLIMPSFVDAHTHIFSGAIAASDYVCSDLGMCRSEEECVEMIKKYADSHPDLKRIRGIGWFVGNWTDDHLPDKRSLDKVLPDIPVYLQCADAHSMWLNTKALNEAGIQPDPDLPNGVIETFPDGSLTGMLIEPAAYQPAMDRYMEFTEEELLDIYRNFQKVLAKNGVSALSEMFVDDYTIDTYNRYGLLKMLDENEGLNANVYVYTKMFGCKDYNAFHEMKQYFNSKHFHIAGLKGFIDGVTETYTGLLLEPYTDKPETCGDGLPLWPEEKMQDEIIRANREGLQVRLHCIADGSVRMALNMYEKSRNINGKSDVRNTVEHIENIHPEDMGRFAELDVIASMQPYHLTLSNNDKIIRIGAQRCRYEWPIRSILEKGAKIAIGTDFPVVELNPFKTIYAALTRKDDDGIPTGHNPWETLDIYSVLKAYTAGAAYLYHAEKEIGSIETGKYANMIVLSKNILKEDPEEILRTEVSANIFEGNLIYQSR